MLIFSNLGKKGNLGNQLFQIASTIGIANKNGHGFAFPKWQYATYFNFNFPLFDSNKNYQVLKEAGFHYSEVTLEVGCYDLNGWFQSENYFDKQAVKQCFEFQSNLVSQVKEKYKEALSKKTILISVRRGDFVNHPYYFQLDYRYYLLGIMKNFPDWKERNLIFTSDDIDYCKNHFKFLSNAIFVEKLNAIEQLILGTLCDDFVISNSTFSWWQAWLGEKKETKIVRPIQNFRGKFKSQNDDKDYFPDRWIAFTAEGRRVEPKYWKLIFKGEFFKIIDNIKYYYRLLIKRTKKFIKRIIGRA
ncbi:alpha-1,2-fucosyltransferase [Seonamhaeicola sp. NFXS20]|uniref:alpha-1,2-fucosyltransferase n=1 Tax=Seonamhaeicola sp. NFXS20 TaxID=2816959 RepID=UPI003B8C7951